MQVAFLSSDALVGSLVATTIAALWLLLGRWLYRPDVASTTTEAVADHIALLRLHSQQLESLRRQSKAIREVTIEVYDSEGHSQTLTAHEMTQEFLRDMQRAEDASRLSKPPSQTR